MITKEELLAAARESAASNAERPLTKAFAAAVAAELSAGDPAWWRWAETAWKDRFFHEPDAALSLLWAAIHFEALGGHPVLAPHLPSCRGTASAALGPAIRQFLASPPPAFQAGLSRTSVSFSTFWASQWLEPAKLFFQRRALPYYVVDVASVGGLAACADQMVRSQGFDPELVEARLGLAHPPLDLRRDDDARWLVACCMPDDLKGISAAAFGARRVRELLSEDASAVQSADCPLELTPAFLAKNLAPTEGVGLLLITARLFETLPPAEYQKVAVALAHVLASWGDRGLWVAAERRPEEGNVFDVTVHRRRDLRIDGHSFKIVRVYSTRSETFGDPAANAAFLA